MDVYIPVEKHFKPTGDYLMIDINMIGQIQIDEEERLQQLLKSSNLDDQSKESVLKRIHHQIQHLNNLIELEEH